MCFLGFWCSGWRWYYNRYFCHSSRGRRLIVGNFSRLDLCWGDDNIVSYNNSYTARRLLIVLRYDVATTAESRHWRVSGADWLYRSENILAVSISRFGGTFHECRIPEPAFIYSTFLDVCMDARGTSHGRRCMLLGQRFLTGWAPQHGTVYYRHRFTCTYLLPD